MPVLSITHMMTAYMSWADDVMLKNAELLPDSELMTERDTLFKTIAGTFDHVLVIGEIFCAHLEGRIHPHTARYRREPLAFNQVASQLRAMNEHYVNLTKGWSVDELSQIVEFEFVGGGKGAMSREQILLHLVNHSTYHRGFVSTLLYPFRLNGAANDLSVFLRDAWPAISRAASESIE